MKIETKLALNNMKKNKKRSVFTTVSIMLCTVLIFTTLILISSIRNGISENIETEYNDYHFIIRNLDVNSFNKIKDKEYIDKIYIQEDGEKKLKEIEKPYTSLNIKNDINVYIKFNNIKKTPTYSTDIIQTLNSSDEIGNIESKYEFNQKLLTIYGLIDVEITEENYSPICRARVNYSYVLDVIVIVILVAFSILFITILYNAFLITINERKKEYAILNSVGGTEGQILKIIFLEAIIMGIIGILIGGLISFLSANIILKLLNNILVDTGYFIELIFDIKYMVLGLLIIIINIYLAAVIPSVKASTTSVIQDIRNNKQIKYKRKNTILEKILPVEGKMAIKNIKRNRNKYRLIIILLVICMTSYIVVSTYINYEKATAGLVNEYDVDAKINLDSTLNNIDYKSILNDYEIIYGSKLEYMEYKMMGIFALVEPEEAIIKNDIATTYEDNKKSMKMVLVGLDDKTYSKYINKLNANYGDFIIYNNVTELKGNEKLTYTYYPALKTGYNLKLSVINTYHDYENDLSRYEIIDNENLNGKFILTDELIEGYKEMSTIYRAPTIFVNMNTYNKIEEKFNNYTPKDNNSTKKWIWSDTDATLIKIKCKDIIKFANYIEDINTKQNIGIDVEYFSLENQEKNIYINIVQLILKVIIIAIIAIGIISTVNIMNASLCEREQDFNILHSLGATKGNINKILIYECIYMFIKATIISIILSIPILYGIIKYIENIIILNKLLIPFGSIFIFFVIILLISLAVTLYSTRIIKDK